MLNHDTGVGCSNWGNCHGRSRCVHSVRSLVVIVIRTKTDRHVTVLSFKVALCPFSEIVSCYCHPYQDGQKCHSFKF